MLLVYWIFCCGANEKKNLNLESLLNDTQSAAALFIEAIKKAKNNEDKALANFNLFQVRWRQAFAEISLSNKEQHYDNALSRLMMQ